MRAKTEKILATTDFSENALVGLRMAAAMAESYGADLYLLNVIPREEFERLADKPTPHVPLDILAARRKERLIKNFEECVPQEGRMGVTVHPMVRFGVPWEEIVKVAEDLRADVVVMATHGRTGLAHLLSGSVTEKVVRRCSRPVLTVRPGEKIPERFLAAKAS